MGSGFPSLTPAYVHHNTGSQVKILLKVKLVYGYLRQRPGFLHHSPPLCLPSLARLRILLPILSPVKLQLPGPKDGTGLPPSRKQRMRDPDRAGKEINMRICLLGYTT